MAGVRPGKGQGKQLLPLIAGGKAVRRTIARSLFALTYVIRHCSQTHASVCALIRLQQRTNAPKAEFPNFTNLQVSAFVAAASDLLHLVETHPEMEAAVQQIVRQQATDMEVLEAMRHLTIVHQTARAKAQERLSSFWDSATQEEPTGEEQPEGPQAAGQE